MVSDINEALEAALDWIVYRPGQIACELGPGLGEFAIQYCQAKPNDFLVLVEVNTDHCNAIARRLAKYGIKNCEVVCGHSEQVLSGALDDGVFDEFHLYFPSVRMADRTLSRSFDKPTMYEITRLANSRCNFFVKSDKEYVLNDIGSQLEGIFVREQWRHPLTGDVSDSELGTGLEARFGAITTYQCVFAKIHGNAV